MSIGDRIKALRVQNRLTQKDLGDKLKKTDAAIRMWELNKNVPDVAVMLQLCQIFNCSIEYLTTGSEYHKPLIKTIPQDHKQLIAYYEACDEIDKVRILAYAEAVAENNKEVYKDVDKTVKPLKMVK